MILCTCLKESSRDETTLERDRKADPWVFFQIYGFFWMPLSLHVNHLPR